MKARALNAVAGLLVSLACGSACSAPTENAELTAISTAQPLLAGALDERHENVVAIARTPDEPFCTGTAIGGRLVLTAAHCVDDAIADDIAVYVGEKAPAFDAKLAVKRIYLHPGWSREFARNDIAVLVLERSLPEPQSALASKDSAVPNVGAALRLVAYGHNGAAAHEHVRRTGEATVKESTLEQLRVSIPNGGVCPGDSGSPAFFMQEGREVLVGVLSRGGADCSEEATYTRVAAYSTFTDAVRRENADGSRKSGQACLDDVHCASGVCIQASDDSEVTFCSDACTRDAQCPEEMRCDTELASGHCVFAGSTPGARGASCENDGDCHSARCGGTGVCTIRCFDDPTICGEDSACLDDARHSGQRSCLPTPTQSSGCSLGRETPGSFGVLMLVALALAYRRRVSRCRWICE